MNQNGLLVANLGDPVSQDMMTLRRLPSLIHQPLVINLGLTLVIRNIVGSFKHAQNLQHLTSKDSDRIYTDNDMVYIETPFENYDLTGLSMLWHYRD